MKRFCWLSGYGARALLATLCLALLSGCSAAEKTGPDTGAHQSTAQRQLQNRRDPAPSAKTLYSMADILATQGKETECEFVLRRCMSEYPQFTPAYNSLAELHMRQGRVHEAVAVLLRALEIRPRDPVLLNNLGMCFLGRKEYAKALEQFTTAAGVVPESEKYRANMATCLGLLGRYEEALALLQQVLPDDKARHNVEILRKARERQAGFMESARG